MSEQVYTLIEELKKYRDTNKRHQDENYFTEILKWYLNNVSYFKVEFLKIIDLPQMIDAKFESQVRLYSGNGFMDLFAETQNEVIIIENKINSPVSINQLKLYFEDVQNRIFIEKKNQRVNLCLITKEAYDSKSQITSIFHDSGIKPIFITWQDLYMELKNNIDDIDQSSAIWKLIDSYFISSGLLRRIPLKKARIKDLTFLKGQCISMMEELASIKSPISELFSDYRKIFNITEFPEKQIIEYRWGRIGLNLRSANPISSKDWWPNIFTGVVIDNNDHKLKPFGGPKVVIIVEWSYKKGTEEKRLNILNTWRDSLYKFKSENQSEHTTIHLNYDLENKWRFIVIEKDLIHFIDKSSTTIQDIEFVEFYTKWLKMLKEKLLIQSIFTNK